VKRRNNEIDALEAVDAKKIQRCFDAFLCFSQRHCLQYDAVYFQVGLVCNNEARLINAM
jgi:hypothetical protein